MVAGEAPLPDIAAIPSSRPCTGLLQFAPGDPDVSESRRIRRIRPNDESSTTPMVPYLQRISSKHCLGLIWEGRAGGLCTTLKQQLPETNRFIVMMPRGDVIGCSSYLDVRPCLWQQQRPLQAASWSDAEAPGAGITMAPDDDDDAPGNGGSLLRGILLGHQSRFGESAEDSSSWRCA